MTLQPVTQETELPPNYGVWFEEAYARLSRQDGPAVQESNGIQINESVKSPRRTNPPLQVAERIPEFEADVANSEQLIEYCLGIFVHLIREAAQSDDNARAFDDWADGQDLAEVLETYENKVVPLYKQHAAILRRVVEGWNHGARTGKIEPKLPKKLAKRVKRLDTRINKLTRQITKREDNELIARLLIGVAKHRPLSGAEKIRLSDAVRMKVKYKTEPSVRRADWYGADGR